MDISLFLGRLIGLMLIIMYAGVLKNFHLYRGYIRSITEHPILLYLSGFLNLLLGLILIFVHNLWVPDWRVLITIFGWLLALSGTFRILFPDEAIKMSNKMLDISFRTMSIICIVMGLIGLFLVYKSM